MANRRKLIGAVLIIVGGMLGLSGLCLLVNALLYLTNVLQLPIDQDVPVYTKLFAIFCLLLPMILLGAGGIFGGLRLLHSRGQGNPEK